MTTTQPGTEDLVIAAQRSAQALPEALADALVAELTTDPENRGYEAALQASDWEQVRTLFHGSYSRHVEAGIEPRTQVSGSELLGWLRDVPLMAALAKSPAISQKWAGLSAAIMPTIVPTEIYNPSGAMLLAFYPQMLADGILTQEQLDAFTTQPRNQDWIPQPPRATGVLGAGNVLDVADLVALRAEERI